MPRLPLALVGSLALLACSDHAIQESVVIDTLPSGGLLVRNQGPTGWPDTSGWRLVLERTIVPSSGSETEFGDPRSITVDASGMVHVFDARPPRILSFPAGDAPPRVLARSGAGPGEVSNRGLLMTSGDTLAFQDQQLTRVQLWGPDGSLLRSWPSRCCIGLDVRADRLGRLPVPGMLFRPTPDEGPFSGLGYARFDLAGNLVDSIRLPARRATGPTWEIDGKAVPVPFGASVRNVLTPDGLIVGGEQSSYALVASRDGTDTVWALTAPTSRVPIPEAARREAFDAIVGRAPFLEPIARLEDVPTTYPAWGALQVDGTGHVWVQVPGTRGAQDHWDVFTPDGQLLGAVPTAFDADARAYWGRDLVHAIVEDSVSGLPELRIYRIVRDVPGGRH